MATLTRPRVDEIRAFAAAYPLPDVTGFRPVEGGTVNSSFALDLSSEKVPVFLRIYDEQGRGGAAAEAALLRHLAERSVPTPAPLPQRNGELVGELCGKPAALFPWVEGRMRCQGGVDHESARLVGVALARMHQAGAGATVPAGRFGAEELF